MTTEEKLKHFEESSMEQAKEQATAMITEHKKALAQLEQEHITEKVRQMDLRLKTEANQIQREKNITLSKRQFEIRREMNLRHDALKDKLFIEIKSRLEQFMSSPAYEKLLIKQIMDIKKRANGLDFIVYIDPADARLRSALTSSTGVEITLSQYTFMGGTRGIILDRHMLIDNSFETKLEEAKENFLFDGGSL